VPFSIQVNPGNAPLVVGQLLDDECPEDFIKGLILSVRSLLPVEPLVEECEKRWCLSFAFVLLLCTHVSNLSCPLFFDMQESASSAHTVLGTPC